MRAASGIWRTAFRLFLLTMAFCTQACGHLPTRTGWLLWGPRGGLDPAAYPKIEALCRKAIEDGRAPGVVLLIGRDDKVLFRKAFGYRMNDPNREPMTVEQARAEITNGAGKQFDPEFIKAFLEMPDEFLGELVLK